MLMSSRAFAAMLLPARKLTLQQQSRNTSLGLQLQQQQQQQRLQGTTYLLLQQQCCSLQQPS
jgi:hypothetical protein